MTAQRETYCMHNSGKPAQLYNYQPPHCQKMAETTESKVIPKPPSQSLCMSLQMHESRAKAIQRVHGSFQPVSFRRLCPYDFAPHRSFLLNFGLSLLQLFARLWVHPTKAILRFTAETSCPVLMVGCDAAACDRILGCYADSWNISDGAATIALGRCLSRGQPESRKSSTGSAWT